MSLKVFIKQLFCRHKQRIQWQQTSGGDWGYILYESNYCPDCEKDWGRKIGKHYYN